MTRAPAGAGELNRRPDPPRPLAPSTATVCPSATRAPSIIPIYAQVQETPRPARFVHGEVAGLFGNAGGIDDCIFRVVAVPPHAQFASGAPDLFARQVAGPLGHNPGIVTARRPRPDKVRHPSEKSLRVTRVYPARVDFDDAFVGTGFGLIDFLSANLEGVSALRFLSRDNRLQ